MKDNGTSGAPSIAEQIKVLEEHKRLIIDSFFCTVPGHPEYGKFTEPGAEREIECVEATIAILKKLSQKDK